MKPSLLGIDLGTSSVKAVLFDSGLHVLSSSMVAYPTLYPREGWAEQKADTWWAAVIQAIREILEKSSGIPSEIAGIGIDTQGAVALPIDRTGKALRPAILWMDRRAQSQCVWIEGLSPNAFQNITANRNDPSNFGPKLLWIKQNEPEIYHKTYKFLHANGYLVYKLTNQWTMDLSEAGLSQLCDTREGSWSEEILGAFEIPQAKLPDIYPCTEVVGQVTEEAARLTGLTAGTPVIAGLMDAIACGAGSGVFSPGQTYVAAGTAQGAGFCLREYVPNSSFHMHKYILPETWIAMGAVDFSGGILRWFNELLGHNDYTEIERLANTSEAGQEFLIFLPYMIGQRSPLWNGNTRGVILGLEPSTSKQDLIRMFIEGCSFGMRYIFDIFERSGTSIEHVIMTGGSTRISMWNQIFADITGKNVDIPQNMDVAPLGAAITAGVGVGVYRDFEETRDTLTMERTYIPQEEHRILYNRMYEIYCRLFESVKGHYDSLANVRQQFQKRSM